jgi:hypothetical protein
MSITIKDVINAFDKCDYAFFVYNYRIVSQFYYNNIFFDKTKTLESLFSIRLFDYDEEHEKNFIMFKFIIENGIIDPAIYINGKLLLANCLSSFMSWDIEKERIELLFKYTFPASIRNFKDSNGNTILDIITKNQFITDDYFDILYNKLVEDVGINISDIEQHKNFLHNITMRLNIKYVKIAINVGHNINYYKGNDFEKRKNTAQILLYNYKYTKNKDIIKKICDIIALLVAKGLNKYYTDLDGRNLMDYIYDYGWGDIYYNDIDNKTNSIIYNKLHYCLTILGFPEKTGNKSSIKETYNIDEYTEPMKLLYNNRYEKNYIKINSILTELKNMKANGEIFSKINRSHNNIYDEFCVRGPWKDSIIADYLNKEITFEQIKTNNMNYNYKRIRDNENFIDNNLTDDNLMDNKDCIYNLL